MRRAAENNKKYRFGPLVVLCALASLSGCASTPAAYDEGDPWEPFNRAMYAFNDDLDKKLLQPIARGYNTIMPGFANKGVTNFFGNIDDVVTVANDVLQFKFQQAVGDGIRVLWNSTFGIAGLIDVSTPMGYPKHEEDFGQTLGRWGVGPGPYVVWPFLGPSTLRDTAGRATDAIAFDPLFWLDSSTVFWSLYALDVVDTRADLLAATRVLEEAALDPYIFVRDAYLQRRQNLVYDGNPPLPEFERF